MSLPRQPSLSAFSLMEIVIAMGVVAIFVTMPIVAYQRYTRQSRDEKRKADISKVQQALEQYKAERGVYPVDLASLQREGYIDQIPVDPKEGQAVPGDPELRYTYLYSSDGETYSLATQLEGEIRTRGGSGSGTFNGGVFSSGTFSGSGSGAVAGNLLLSGNVNRSQLTGTLRGTVTGAGASGTAVIQISGSVSGTVQGEVEGNCGITGTVTGALISGTVQVCVINGKPATVDKGRFIVQPAVPGGVNKPIAQLTKDAQNPTKRPPTVTRYLSPTHGGGTRGPTITPVPCTASRVCPQTCAQLPGRCGAYTYQITGCTYTTRPNVAVCRPAPAPDLECPVSGQICAPGSGCINTTCYPNCNSGVECSGSCQQISGKCAPPGSYLSTRDGCSFTTFTGGGTCFSVAAPNQSCSITNQLCPGNQVCVGNNCLVPTSTPTPTPQAQPTIPPPQLGGFARIIRNQGQSQYNTQSSSAPDGSLWAGAMRNSNRDIFELRKFANNGSALYALTQTTTDSTASFLPVLMATSDGGVLTVVTQWYSPGTQGRGSVIQKRAQDGTLQWSLALRAPGSYNALHIAAAIEHQGSFILAGQSGGWSTSGAGIVFVTRIAADGTILWARVVGALAAPASWGSAALGVNVNTSGEVTVFAVSDQQGYTAGSSDAHFYRLSLANGSLISAKRFGNANQEAGLDFNYEEIQSRRVAVLPGGGYAWHHKQGQFEDPRDRLVVVDGLGSVRRSYTTFSEDAVWYPRSFAGVPEDQNKLLIEWTPALLETKPSISLFSLGSNMTMDWNRRYQLDETTGGCIGSNKLQIRGGAFSLPALCYNMTNMSDTSMLLLRSNASASINSCQRHLIPPEPPDLLPAAGTNIAEAPIQPGEFNSHAVEPELASPNYATLSNYDVINSCQ